MSTNGEQALVEVKNLRRIWNIHIWTTVRMEEILKLL
jgi:hypothetical protein